METNNITEEDLENKLAALRVNLNNVNEQVTTQQSVLQDLQARLNQLQNL